MSHAPQHQASYGAQYATPGGHYDSNAPVAHPAVDPSTVVQAAAPVFPPAAPGHVQLTTTPSSNGSNRARNGGGPNSNVKHRTYQIIRTRNPSTGKMELSYVWGEITEKGNPKNFLGYFGFEDDGSGQPSEAAKAIGAIIETAEQNPDFRTSSATQTTITIDTIKNENGDVTSYSAELKKGKKTVKLTHDQANPQPNSVVIQAFETLDGALDNLQCIIDHTGAEFNPRAKKTEAGDSKKREMVPITQDNTNQIDPAALNNYLGRVQDPTAPQLHLRGVCSITNLNSKPNKKAIEGLKDKPVFIPVVFPDVGETRFVYLCKDGDTLHYYDPRGEAALGIKTQEDTSRWYFGNSIGQGAQTPLAKAIQEFSYQHGIKQLKVATTPAAGGNYSDGALGVQWLTHLSKLSQPLSDGTVFLPRVPDAGEIEVPVALHDANLTDAERAKKVAAAPAPVAHAQPVALPYTQIFGERNPRVTKAQENAWIQRLGTIVDAGTAGSREGNLKALVDELPVPKTRKRGEPEPVPDATEPMLKTLGILNQALGSTTLDYDEIYFNANAIRLLYENERLRKQFCPIAPA
jgi:hypothetical protein